MRKTKVLEGKDEMRPEYDFAGGVRGTYVSRCAQGTNIVVLEPDVAKVFPTSKAVNRALRALAQIAAREARLAAR